MYFVGVDVAKRSHEAIILNESGEEVAGSFSFANSTEGAKKLMARIQPVSKETKEILFCLEATGHYWLALYCFLTEHGYQVLVINPIQSDALRDVCRFRFLRDPCFRDKGTHPQPSGARA